MNRPYTAQSPYSLTATERIRSRYGGGHDTDDYTDLSTDAIPAYRDDDYRFAENFDDYDIDDYNIEDIDAYDIDEASIDRRWMWIAGGAGGILFVAVIIASLILGGGDSGSVSATVVSTPPPTTSAAPAEPTAPRVAAPPSLPAETVTTVTPAPRPTAQTPTSQPVPPPLTEPQAAPPQAAAPGTVTYRITGDKRLIDMVTVIYTDQQGALVTDVNVSLPWSKTVVLNPGVTLSSVTATSIAGKLNCAITDANGALIAAQNNNSIITNCTR